MALGNVPAKTVGVNHDAKELHDWSKRGRRKAFSIRQALENFNFGLLDEKTRVGDFTYVPHQAGYLPQI